MPLVLTLVLFGAYWVLSERLAGRISAAPESPPAHALRYLLFAAVVAFIFVAVKIVDVAVFDLFSRGRRIGAPTLLREIVALALYAVLIAWAVSWVFHRSIRGLLATTTVVAAVIGLALQETLGNLFSGISLHMEGSFEIGDVLESSGHIGIVEHVGWRSTRLRTFRNTVVVLPNSVIGRDRLEVFPRRNLNARVVNVSAGYETPPTRAIEVLEQAVSNVEGVSIEPPCLARLKEFADSSVVYEVKYWTRRYPEVEDIDAAIRKAAWYAFRRNGISIPYPIRSFQKYVPAASAAPMDSAEILNRLNSVDMLAPLSPEEHRKLAGSTKVRRFASGETILRTGQTGDSMFLVHDGRVSVRIPNGGSSSEVAQLAEGALFGEMALLTGELRTADVVCMTDVTALEIGKESLHPVLQDNPALAAALSEKVVERRRESEATKQSGTEEESGMLARVRSWFSL